MRGSKAAVGVALLASTACVGPARTHNDFQLKAKSTAETTLSAVGTTQLVVRLAADDRAFANYLSVLIGDAEEEATSAQATFDSIQPPNEDSDALRSQLDELLSTANDAIAEVRIAVRRGQLSEVATDADELAQIAKDLNSFIESQP
jgi:light-regulated signal transduction histidine kinase (bacteriophytochrome)